MWPSSQLATMLHPAVSHHGKTPHYHYHYHYHYHCHCQQHHVRTSVVLVAQPQPHAWRCPLSQGQTALGRRTRRNLECWGDCWGRRVGGGQRGTVGGRGGRGGGARCCRPRRWETAARGAGSASQSRRQSCWHPAAQTMGGFCRRAWPWRASKKGGQGSRYTLGALHTQCPPGAHFSTLQRPLSIPAPVPQGATCVPVHVKETGQVKSDHDPGACLCPVDSWSSAAAARLKSRNETFESSNRIPQFCAELCAKLRERRTFL